MTTPTIAVDSQLPAAPTVRESRGGAVAIHLLTIPFGLGAVLVAWLVTRKRSAWIRQQVRQALNWQLNFLLLAILEVPVKMFLIPYIEASPVPLPPQPSANLLRIIEIACIVYATVRAYRGAWMPYPKLFRIVKPLPESERG